MRKSTPLKQTVEDAVDSIIARHGGPPRFVAMSTSEWTTPFEARLPFRLSPSFVALIRRYRFPSFDLAGVTLFGNVDGVRHDDVAVRVFRDPILATVTQRGGLRSDRHHDYPFL